MVAIGLYEVHAHEHILYYFSKIATAADFEVTVFTTPDIETVVADSLGDATAEIDWVLKSEDESHRHYLDRVSTVCHERLDVFIAQSIYGNLVSLLPYLTFSPRCKSILWVYNTKQWLNTPLSWNSGLKGNIHTVFRNRIVRNFDAINVEYPPMERYVETSCSYDNPVYNLVPTLCESTDQPASDGVQITVPGGIAEHRRDYDLVLEVFEAVSERYEDKLTFHLLGNPAGEFGASVVDRCSDLVADGHDIVWYDQKVPKAKFDSVLRESTFIFSPVHPRIEVIDGIYEDYGTTKGSGNVYDALRTATPLILPASFEVDDIIEGSTVTYEDARDLAATVLEVLRDDQRLDDLEQAAVANATQFRLEKQCERFSAMIADILDR
jgi:glycosyltransferase involved in cell wall biosynthesis